MNNPSPSGEWTDRRIGRRADQLFLYCFLAYTCSYLGRKNLSACLPAIIAEGLLDKTYAGYVTTAYMLVYGIGQMVSGLLAARIKPKYLIGTGLVGAGLCNLVMSFAPPALFPVIWALNGACHSLLWSPIIRVFTDLLPAGKRERAGVNIAASCSIGAVLAYLIPALVLKLAGWRVVFVVSGCVLLAAAAVWVVGHGFLRSYIAHMEKVCFSEREALRQRAAAEAPSAVATATATSKKRSLIGVFAVSGLWLMLFSLLCNGALRDAVETWAPTFLSEQFGLEESLAALCSVLIPIFSLVGPYVAEALHHKLIRNEIYTGGLLFVLATVCIVGIYFTRESSVILCAVFMAVSVAAMFGTNHMFLTVVPYHFAPMGLSATVSGTLNSIIYLATALFSSAYGIIAETAGWSVLILVWLGVGIGGILFCALAGWLWGRKYPLLDQGKL